MTRALRQLEQGEALTANEAVLKYGLNWDVVLQDVTVGGVPAPEFKGVVRADTGYRFQIASNRYEPIQNRETFGFFDEITGTGQAKYVNGGSYNGGAVVWLRAKVPYDFDVVPGDTLKTYLKIITSHDGSQRLKIVPEVYRQICTNGAHAFVEQYARAVSVKHTKNAGTRFVFNAKQTLEREVEYFNKFVERSRQLAARQFTSLEIDSFLNKLFKIDETKEVHTKTKNQIARIKELVEVGTGMDIPGVRGTAWGVYNAVTEYIDNDRPTKGDKTNGEYDENREFAAEFGGGRDLREEAFELLLK